MPSNLTQPDVHTPTHTSIPSPFFFLNPHTFFSDRPYFLLSFIAKGQQRPDSLSYAASTRRIIWFRATVTLALPSKPNTTCISCGKSCVCSAATLFSVDSRWIVKAEYVENVQPECDYFFFFSHVITIFLEKLECIFVGFYSPRRQSSSDKIPFPKGFISSLRIKSAPGTHHSTLVNVEHPVYQMFFSPLFQ